jgi:hypothetical protein
LNTTAFSRGYTLSPLRGGERRYGLAQTGCVLQNRNVQFANLVSVLRFLSPKRKMKRSIFKFLLKNPNPYAYSPNLASKPTKFSSISKILRKERGFVG